MSTHLPITDEDRRRHRASKDRTLADLLPPPAEQPTAVRPELPAARWRQFAGAILIVALIALVAWLAFRPALTDQRPPAAATAPASTAAPALDARPVATPAPTIAPTEAPTAVPEPPTPEPIYIPVEPPCDAAVNPRYVVQIDVWAGDRPLGQVVGVSCDSQADAQANAEQHAADLRAAQPTAVPPTLTPSMIVPRPPTNRPKPMQPPAPEGSGQSPIEIWLAAAPWPASAAATLWRWL